MSIEDINKRLETYLNDAHEWQEMSPPPVRKCRLCGQYDGEGMPIGGCAVALRKSARKAQRYLLDEVERRDVVIADLAKANADAEDEVGRLQAALNHEAVVSDMRAKERDRAHRAVIVLSAERAEAAARLYALGHGEAPELPEGWSWDTGHCATKGNHSCWMHVGGTGWSYGYMANELVVRGETATLAEAIKQAEEAS